ncbi:S1C family serine protease [Pseudarthrobacter sp. 1C304]|uniref:S1C family serine protease n=1 Tax=Pseudarthrobacter sp. 1C304 TaxID=3457438 RepID=UPI003FD2070B
MTDNPAQGASPENREPATPREDPSRHPQAASAPGSAPDQARDSGPDSPQGPSQDNPTLRLDREADNRPQPVYPQHQPSYGRPPETQRFGTPQGGFQYGQNPYGQGQYGGFGSNQPASPYAGNPAHAPKRKAAFGVPTLVASILAAGLVGGGVVAGTTQLVGGQPVTSMGSSSSSQAGPVIVNNREDVNAITAAAVKATPSVVTIKASSGSEGGTGSGIILDGEGHVLTNTHVVTLDGTAANADIEVRLSDGKVYSATIVGTDPLSDLAIVKIENAGDLVPAVLGDSSKLNVGDTAVAIGSPLGLTGTVTDGIVSTLNRTISVASSAAPKDNADNPQGGDQGFQFAPPDGGQGQSTANQGSIAINVIQTDAAINPGNSGGALVNTKGEIIGVNVAIASAGGDSAGSGNIGVGFSIPINHAKRVAQEIISTGKATHGQFGVSVKQKTASSSASGFSVGAEVATVEPDSAADKAGVKVGDVVTRFQDLAISDPNQLTAAVREQPAGATVKVTVIRGGKEQELDVTLGAAAEQ